MDPKFDTEYQTACENQSTQWVHGWDNPGGAKLTWDMKHGGGYLHAFSGRNTSRHAFHAHKIDMRWTFELKIGGVEQKDVEITMDGVKKTMEVDVISLVQLMMEVGWDTAKE
jgi:hypothetical protein